MEENSNVKGRKTLKNPTPGNPASSSSKGNPKTSKKRKNLGPTGSGLTPEDKKQQQGNSSVKQPGLVSQSPGYTIPKVSSETGGNSTQNSEASAKEIDNSDASSRAGSNRSLRTKVDDSQKTPDSEPLGSDEEDESKKPPDSGLLESEEEMDQSKASPRSISSLAESKLLLDDDDLDRETELGDLNEETEIKIGEEALNRDGKSQEEPGKEPQVKKVKSYAAAAKASAKSVKGYEILYIHQGETERNPIPKDTFTKLWGRLETIFHNDLITAITNGQDTPPDEINWRSWSQGRGLVSVKDKATSDYVIGQVAKIKIKKNSFRAWHRGEFGEGKLATAFLEGDFVKNNSGEMVMETIMKQNKLKGRYSGIITNVKENGRLLKFFSDQDLWNDLLGRRISQDTPKVKLKVCLSVGEFSLSKAKRAAEPVAAPNTIQEAAKNSDSA